LEEFRFSPPQVEGSQCGGGFYSGFLFVVVVVVVVVFYSERLIYFPYGEQKS